MEKKHRILVVDDEPDLCEILQFNLETEGYMVDVAYSATDVMSLPLAHYDLFLLDVMMGEVSGFQLAEKLKMIEETSHTPVIFTTALDDEDNIIRGFNIGADDYITKPISIRELKARVKAVLRRGNRKEEVEPEKGKTMIGSSEGLSINLQTKCVMMDGVVVDATKLEFDLLRVFLENKGVVFTREDLLARAWPKDAYVTDRTVDVNITRLRKKIGKYGANIKTRIGWGYYYNESEE
jgi:DNA-binding response OmpR family regulator